jgi:antitoxin component of MazEF toxin-antitoxin module
MYDSPAWVARQLALKHYLAVAVFGALSDWVSPTRKRDSADLLAFVVHATARGLHREKEAAGTALKSATTCQDGVH